MGTVEIVLGPTNSGKTRTVTDQYLDCVKRHGDHRAMLILPASGKAAQTRKNVLLDHKISGLLCARIMTFKRVIELVLEIARYPASAITDVGRFLLLKDIVKKMDEAGELVFFKGVAGFPGLLEVAGQLIRELKLCEVTPEQFSDALDRKGCTTRDGEIAAIYSTYQRELHERALYDTEGGYWIATEILRTRGAPELQDLVLVVVDGFHSFTSAELTVVEELSKFVPRVLFTLDYDDAPDRRNLFAAPARTLLALRQRFPDIKETVLEAHDADTPLAALECGLFRDRASGSPLRIPALGKIQVVEAPSELREVEEIAREAKRLVFECGHEPDDIAVIFRTLDVYAPLVRDTFDAYGLPYRIGRAEPLSRDPAVKTVLNAIAVLEEDWERDSVIRFIKSNYVGFGADWSELLPDWVERWARSTGILRKRDQWLRRIKTKKRALELQKDFSDADEPLSENDRLAAEQTRRNELAEITEVLRFVQELGKLLDIVPDEGTIADFTVAVREVLRRLGVKDAILCAETPELITRDLRAYARFLEILGEMEQIDRRQDKHELAQFCTNLRHVLDREHQVQPRVAEGKISVLNIDDARHYRFPVVFVGGLVEKVFPRHHGQDPLYDDSARRSLAGHGVHLQERGTKNAEEMFLFYAAVTRATDRLCLTYPVTDAKGQSRMRSFYLDEVLDLLEPAAQRNEMLYSEPVPEPGSVWNTSDLGLWLFNALWTRDGKKERRSHAAALYNRAVETRREPMRRAVLNAYLEERRQSPDFQDEYDGVLTNTRVLQQIAETYSQEHAFSPTALENYGCCPFMFFCKRVLRLEPIEEPEEELTAIDRGNLYHNILWRFYTELRDQSGGPVQLLENERDALVARIIEVAHEECDRFERVGPVGNRSLWRLVRRAIERNLERFIDHEIENSRKRPDRCPAFFELCFGLKLQPPYDANSMGDPLIVDDVRLCGKIDRVDVSEKDTVCVVVDYKTGNAQTSWREVAEGRSFQLPVYWMACEELLLRGRGTQCVEAELYRLCGDYEKAEKGLRRGKSDWETALAKCREYIKEYAKSIRCGIFPVFPSDECPGWCDYKEICRYERGRIERKIEKVLPDSGGAVPGLSVILDALRKEREEKPAE